jgi:predicted ATPase/DNA-binding XRE family transcriptional regulator
LRRFEGELGVAEPLELSFSALLRQLRIKAGLTQEELAEAAKLSPRSVSDLERGINRTARKDTAQLLADALSLAQPVRDVFVEAARGRASAADVLAALSALRHNLPAPVDSFIGRQAELAEITSALRADRLVTLTGPGGSGKTRLALAAASSVVPVFPDGVWLVALATISDGSRLGETVAQALKVQGAAGETTADALEHWLRDRDLLLVLDNCEHVIAAAADFCERFLAACNGLRILATSREFLDVRGERAMHTPPLAVPDDPALAPESDAVQLFLARAAAGAPQFRAAEADLRTVMAVCRRLDGLPLAIELAAARLRALSLAQLSARLDDQFWSVTGGSRGAVPGHSTLEAVVAWSYKLLTDAERYAFARLAVFPDHFSLEMAESVITGAPVGQLDVVDVLASLVGKSLVTTVNAPDGLRYQLLEMLRQYGRDRLAERGEAEVYRERLLAWAMTGVEYLESVIRTASMDDALRQATVDSVTYRAAMQWAAAHGQPGSALRIASMVPLSDHRGDRRAEILQRLSHAADADQLDDAAAGHAWAAVTNIAFEQNDWEAALEAGDRAVGHYLAAGFPRLAAWSEYLKAHSAWGAGQLAEVDRLVASALATFRRENDEMGLGYSLWVASLRSADLGTAKDMAAEAAELLRRVGVPTGVAHAVEGQGIIACERGELIEAAGFVTEAIEILATYGNLGCTAHVLETAAVVVSAAGPGNGAEAAELLAAAGELRRQSGQGHAPWEIRARLGALEDRIGVSATPAVPTGAAGTGPRYTLSVASSLGIQALRSLAVPAAD